MTEHDTDSTSDTDTDADSTSDSDADPDQPANICGMECSDGTDCQRPAGWGTQADIGPCVDHRDTGRPSSYTHDKAERAIEAARDALSKAGCARAAGVDKATLLRWLDRNPTLPDGTAFRTAFTRARHEGEHQLVHNALVDDDIDGQHARFLLSTSFDYIKTEQRNVKVDNDADFWQDSATVTAGATLPAEDDGAGPDADGASATDDTDT